MPALAGDRGRAADEVDVHGVVKVFDQCHAAVEVGMQDRSVNVGLDADEVPGVIGEPCDVLASGVLLVLREVAQRAG